jgi:hypothetical protein
MSKIFLYVNGEVFHIKKTGISTVSPKDAMECKGGICLYYDSSRNAKDSYLKPHDKQTKESLIKSDISNTVNINVSNKIRINDNNLYFALNRSRFIAIVTQYEFAKIFPLEYIFFKLGTGVSGIIDKKVVITNEIKDIRDVQSQHFLSDGTKQFNLFYADINKTEILKSVFDSLGKYNGDMNIVALGEMSNYSNFGTLDFDALESIVKLDKFHLVDNVSPLYKRRVVKKYLLYSDFMLIAVGSILLYLSYTDFATNYILDTKVDSVQEKKSKVQKRFNTIKATLPHLNFKDMESDLFYENINFLRPFNISKHAYSFDKKKMNASFDIIGIYETRAFLNYLKTRRDIKYKYNAVSVGSETFHFTLEFNIKKYKEGSTR